MPTPTTTSAPTPASIVQGHRSNAKQTALSHRKLIIFPVGELRLAVPMDNISRVINRPRVYSSGTHAVGVTTVGDRELTTVDLHQQLFGTPGSFNPERPGYLVLTPSPTGEIMGIPTPETPMLLEVPLAQIRELPQSYRQADTLWVASHMIRTAVEEGGELQSIFLLDMAAVMDKLMS